MSKGTNSQHPLRIGTRGSPLALAQAHLVRDALLAAHNSLQEQAIEIVALTTRGDKIQNRTLADLGGKGLFTEEIEGGLLEGSLDLAVHSMKDMPTLLPDGLTIAAMLERGDVRDGFIGREGATLADLPTGATIGTASLRRQAQILNARPDLSVAALRGNVQTRLRKLQAGEVDGTLLAMAGLNRLGIGDVATEILNPDRFLPAIAQGAIGIEIHGDREDIAALLRPLAHAPTERCVNTERAFLGALDGSCRTPIAGLARLGGGQIDFTGEILAIDGSVAHRAHRSGAAAEAVALGEDAAAELRRNAGSAFFDDLAR